METNLLKPKVSFAEKYPNFDRVTVATLSFLLLFTAFNSADNLAAKVLRDDGYSELGFYSMSCLYLVFAITGFTSKALVNKLKTPSLGYRLPLFLGGTCYFFRILCFLLPATYGSNYHTVTSVLILVTAALNGFGAGILWVA